MATDKKYSVSEITRLIKFSIEEEFPSIQLIGELSNFKRHSSGHLYFSLKDEGAQISALMWRGRAGNLSFDPEDGMKVVAKGRITLFEKAGKYQLETSSLEKLGVGELQAAFEELKNKLKDEGLFDQEYKKTLPQFPEKIGIVTSATGAAIRDFKSVIHRRFPGVEIVLRPANVQGQGSAEDIAAAIDEFNEYGEIDVMIIGRGGGSLEDLWAFNEEVVARAIFKSNIPVISAVGHEVDFSISDFVADVRAATPSAAGEIVVQKADDVWEFVRQKINIMYKNINKMFEYNNEKLDYIVGSRGMSLPFESIKQYNMQLDLLSTQLDNSYKNIVEKNKIKIDNLEHRLKSLSPESVLDRGYAIVYNSKGEPVKNSSELKKGDELLVKLSKGSVETIVKDVN